MRIPDGAMVGLRRTREVVNPALRMSLGRLPRGAWPGRAMNVLGCGAAVMAGRDETVMLCGIFQAATIRDFSVAVGPQGRVMVVEANPRNTERLSNEVADLANVSIDNRAVWHEDMPLSFEFADQSEHQHYNRVQDTTMQDFPIHMIQQTETVKVLGERLTTVMDRHEVASVDHLNLTVNGAELSAFEGEAGRLLAPRVSRIYSHTEFPDPGASFDGRLGNLGFETKVSGRLNSRNPNIDLRRLYAWKK